MTTVAIQRGHCFRTRGATGTSGHRGTEQEFANALGQAMTRIMRARGHTVHLLTADEAVPKTQVFVALHQDGSSSSSAHGASVGYQTNRSKAYAQTWKAKYAAAGWPGGFRGDNYTAALSGYYGFRRADSEVEVVFEHGFATNRRDEDWMWDHLNTIARVHTDTLDHYYPTKDTDLTPEQDRRLKRVEQALWDGVPGYGQASVLAASNQANYSLAGIDANDKSIRHFIQDQDRATRRVGKESVDNQTVLIEGMLDDLFDKIEDLADGDSGGPVTITPADRAAIAADVVDLWAQRSGRMEGHEA